MHSYIFQVSDKPIPVTEYATESRVFSSDKMDHAIPNDAKDRESAIKRLLGSVAPGAFVREGDAFILVDAQPLLDHWEKSIDAAYASFKSRPMTEPGGRWGIENAIKRPIGFFLFYIDERGYTSNSDTFVEWLGKMPSGTKIYIGAVYDYHV